MTAVFPFTLTADTVRVTIGGTDVAYPLLAGKLAKYTAAGGHINELGAFTTIARDIMAQSGRMLSVQGWVYRNGDTSLAYLVDVAPDHVLFHGAAPVAAA